MPLALTGASQLDFWEHLADFIAQDVQVRATSDTNRVAWKRFFWMFLKNKDVPKQAQFATALLHMETIAKDLVKETNGFFQMAAVCFALSCSISN